jgi:hypothetical protein
MLAAHYSSTQERIKVGERKKLKGGLVLVNPRLLDLPWELAANSLMQTSMLPTLAAFTNSAVWCGWTLSLNMSLIAGLSILVLTTDFNRAALRWLSRGSLHEAHRLFVFRSACSLCAHAGRLRFARRDIGTAFRRLDSVTGRRRFHINVLSGAGLIGQSPISLSMVLSLKTFAVRPWA